MNKQRRREIIEVIKRIEKIVSSILSDEEEAFDNMPENLQNSERGDISQDAQDNLSCAVDSLEEAISYLEEASE